MRIKNKSPVDFKLLVHTVKRMITVQGKVFNEQDMKELYRQREGVSFHTGRDTAWLFINKNLFTIIVAIF